MLAVLVHDDERNQSGVHHLDQILARAPPILASAKEERGRVYRIAEPASLWISVQTTTERIDFKIRTEPAAEIEHLVSSRVHRWLLDRGSIFGTAHGRIDAAAACRAGRRSRQALARVAGSACPSLRHGSA